ncbi:hypothetical protein HJFPF1_00948 [Paramyrothecium foliicola]|nr:hypothetical protein HJFPF1_00948 [Paramyrothecium foliicola]
MASHGASLVRSILGQACRRNLILNSAPRLAVPRSQRSLAASIRARHSIPRPPPRQPLSETKPSEPSPAQAASTSSASSQPSAPWQDADVPNSEGERPEPRNPAYYQLSFTCVPCGHRSHHNISKQGYHHGSTLITCPSCRNRHVISDHLNIFGDRKITVEDLMREKGQLIKRGSLGEDGDIEFWPDDYSQQEAGGADASKAS